MADFQFYSSQSLNPYYLSPPPPPHSYTLSSAYNHHQTPSNYPGFHPPYASYVPRCFTYPSSSVGFQQPCYDYASPPLPKPPDMLGSGHGCNQSSSPRSNRPPHNPLQKLKEGFPVFDGSDVRDWIFKCEQFFRFNATDEDTKVRLATIQMSGRALQWHYEYITNRYGVYPSWSEYSDEISKKFSGIHKDSMTVLLSVKNEHKSVKETLALKVQGSICNKMMVPDLKEILSTKKAPCFIASLREKDQTGFVGLCHKPPISDDQIENVPDRFEAGESKHAKENINEASMDCDPINDSGSDLLGAVSEFEFHEIGSERYSGTSLVLAQVELRAVVPPPEVDFGEIEEMKFDNNQHEEKLYGADKDEKSKRREMHRDKEERDRKIQAVKGRLLENYAPESVEEFEKLVRSSPNNNNNFVWIKYMESFVRPLLLLSQLKDKLQLIIWKEWKHKLEKLILNDELKLVDTYGLKLSEVILTYLSPMFCSEILTNEDTTVEILQVKEDVHSFASDSIQIISIIVYTVVSGLNKEHLAYIYGILSDCYCHLEERKEASFLVQSHGSFAGLSNIYKILKQECSSVSFITYLGFKSIAGLGDLNSDSFNNEIHTHINEMNLEALTKMVETITGFFMESLSKGLISWQDVHKQFIVILIDIVKSRRYLDFGSAENFQGFLGQIQQTYDHFRVYFKILYPLQVVEILKRHFTLVISLNDMDMHIPDSSTWQGCFILMINFWIRLVDEMQEVQSSNSNLVENHFLVSLGVTNDDEKLEFEDGNFVIFQVTKPTLDLMILASSELSEFYIWEVYPIQRPPENMKMR